MTLAEVELGGKRILPGHQVFCVLGAANHDPDVFSEPERFDIRRSNAGDHLAFGAGVHFCLGHYLAHSEGRIALRRLFEAFPKLRLDPAQPLPPAMFERPQGGDCALLVVLDLGAGDPHERLAELTALAVSALPIMPIFTASTDRSEKTLSICCDTKAGGTS